MSESQGQVSIPAPPDQPQNKTLKNSEPKKESPFPNRLVLILVFITIITGTFAYSPFLVETLAYAWNRGIERAKAEVAKKILEEHPSLPSEQRIAWVAKAVSPSVVGLHIIAAHPTEEQMYPHRRSDEIIGTNLGSGVIVDPRGYILTNYHVVAHAHIVSVQLSDGREIEAQIIGQDRSVDLAVLQIDLEDIQAAEWGDSQNVTVGEQVIAIGSPYGLQQTVTSGIISATERYDDTTSMPQRTSRGWQASPQVFMQTDAAINPGNSGGALVDMNGKLIGICTAIISDHGSNSGIGLVIPSYKAKIICDEIVKHGEVRHGWIGVQLDQVRPFQAKQMNQTRPKGAVIARIMDKSPAGEAGLRKGDIILRWGETEISTPLHLTHLLLFTPPETKETVEVYRDGGTIALEVSVGTRPLDL